MRRATTMAAGTLVWLLAIAAPALAQATYPPSQSVAAGGGTDRSGTAFTGGEPVGPILLAASLFVLGVVALLVARRRAERFAER